MTDRATRTREDYAVRIERLIAWLAEHLDEEIELARMADVACMSSFHFHRIYHAMQGETVTDTVRRLRLHRAAVDLITGERPVPRIARRAGYGSQQAFTRAFKVAYGVPPARYRAVLSSSPARVVAEGVGSETYEVSIRDVPPLRVAALAHHGDYQTQHTTFQRLATIAAGQGFFSPSTRVFGIYHDDATVTPSDALRSEACLTVPDGWTPRGELRLLEIRGGRYAVTLHVGPYSELQRRYTWLYGTWLPRSGEEADDAPCVGEYLDDPRAAQVTELRTEFWLPLR